MLNKIKNKLLLTEPFFGYLLLKLKFVEDSNVRTMATDGVTFWYAPDFVKNEEERHLMADIIHELLHCVFKHPIRGKDHNIKISNYAADYVINDYILNKTDFKLQEWVLYDPRFTNMSYEAVYQILLDECDGVPDPGKIELSEKQGTFIPNDGGTVVDNDINITLEEYLDNNIQEAGNIITKINNGKLTDAQKIILKSTKAAQLPWEKLLNRFLNGISRSGASWNRPSRRFIAQGIYLPSKRSKSLESLVAAIDSSCSVTATQFEHQLAEINKILLKLKPKKFIIIQCDEQIVKVETFTPRDYPITTTIEGRRCTAFEPVFKYIEEHKLNPNCLIYFTDLESGFDFEVPKYPVLWINTSPYNELEAPFGTTIRVKT